MNAADIREVILLAAQKLTGEAEDCSPENLTRAIHRVMYGSADAKARQATSLATVINHYRDLGSLPDWPSQDAG